MSISLCMISKNEEECIGNALESAVDFVDEIIVVDTGSNDKTIEIAKSYNAKVILSEWSKDFSFHRNESICNAKCDWILFIDCDEIIQNEGKNEVKKILSNTENSIKGYNLNIVNVIDNLEVASFESLRLFKNFENFYFQGPIHEQIIQSVVNKYGMDSIGNLPMTVNHYGYDDLVLKNKHKFERNIEILNSIEDKNGYIYAMMGDEYLKSYDLAQAIDYYEKSLEVNNTFTQDYSHMLIINYTSSLINLRRYGDALSFINLVKSKLPYFRDLYFLEFWILYYSNNFEKALVKLDEYTNLTNRISQILEIKKFYNIYNLNDMRSKIISMTCSNINLTTDKFGDFKMENKNK